MKRDNLIIQSLYRILLYYVFLVVLFFSFRIIYLFSFGEFEQYQQHQDYFFSVISTSLRFDTTTILYSLSPLLLLSLAYVLIPASHIKKYSTFNRSFYKIYGLFVGMFLVIIVLLDFFFFKTYGHHFSPIIFGLKDDDTLAISISMWYEYPIIKIVFFWLFLAYIIRKVLLFLSHKSIEIHLPKSIHFVFISIFILLYFIGLRGTLATHALDLRQASVTDNQFLNRLTINPVFALKEAISNKAQTDITDNYNTSLIDNGFTTLKDAETVYFGSSSIHGVARNKLLYKTTPKNDSLAQNPPNVIFILAESFSRHLFDLDTSHSNLLGDLKPELAYCYTFKNTLSSGNLTITSLENILTGTPYTPIAQSPYKNIPLSTSIVNPFKKAHYTTNFIYGGLYGWRDLGDYLKVQGFENIMTQRELELMYPNASKFSWGLHDEYLYDKAFNILKNKTNPQFIFILTLSNHTPYQLPEDFKPKPIHFPDSLYSKMRMDKELVDKSLRAYQYANTQLGQFIHKIRTSEFGKNTLIVITGDHNLHRGFNYDESESFLAHSVPIIFYIPDKYKPSPPNTKIFASHKDIFPSIYPLALSNATYFNTGQNLFTDLDHFSINDFTFAANRYGAVTLGDVTHFYKWTDSTKNHLIRSQKNEYLDILSQKLKAYKAIMGYTIQKELSQKENE